MKYEITAIITASKEGSLAVASIRSFEKSVEFANKNGLKVEKIYCLDNPTEITSQIFANLLNPNEWKSLSFTYADQGKVRNAAVLSAKGEFIAFLDADDLWTEDWLVSAYEFSKSFDYDVIVHPNYNYFFEGQATIYEQIDPDDLRFDLDLFRSSNYWDALSFCPKHIHEKYPYIDRELDLGFAYEDHNWNLQTFGDGIKHKILIDTVIFKRRQKMSQTIKASTNKSIYRPTPLNLYSHNLYNRK